MSRPEMHKRKDGVPVGTSMAWPLCIMFLIPKENTSSDWALVTCKRCKAKRTAKGGER